MMLRIIDGDPQVGKVDQYARLTLGYYNTFNNKALACLFRIGVAPSRRRYV